MLTLEISPIYTPYPKTSSSGALEFPSLIFRSGGSGKPCLEPEGGWIPRRAGERPGLVDGSWTASLFPGMWQNEKDWETLDEPILLTSNHSDRNPDIWAYFTWIPCLLLKVSRR